MTPANPQTAFSRAEFIEKAYPRTDRLPKLASTKAFAEGGTEEERVPLSEEEMRLLEQLERALVEEDPKFASTLRGGDFGRGRRTRMVAGAVGFLAGAGAMLAGVIVRQTWVGIVGFLVMLAAAVVGLAAWRGQRILGSSHPRVPDDASGLTLIQGGRRGKPASASRGKQPKQRSGSFMERLENRWHRRRDQGR